ncbi:UDP-N-acetylmuramoylalanine--D-glutamate ligase [Eubacterium plexicaudatum ASF492]|nr:UDP-N-acetylmuramoylalanine--D-glutamate ligase [Eubacterium plexicaudatum ASF492]
MELKGKKALVFGTGISGVAAAQLLAEKGADIILYDSNENLCKEDIRAKADALASVPIMLGKLDADIINQLDVAVLSPGVATDNPIVTGLYQSGVTVWERLNWLTGVPKAVWRPLRAQTARQRRRL